jgi:hypothetical protein
VIICLALAVVYVVVAWLVPLVRNDGIRLLKPTGQFDGICGGEKVDNDDKVTEETKEDGPIFGELREDAD